MNTDAGPVNASCLSSDYNEPIHSTAGRCNVSTSKLAGDLTWAYDFCPTQFAWMAMAGLVLYLVFFAPGEFFINCNMKLEPLVWKALNFEQKT